MQKIYRECICCGDSGGLNISLGTFSIAGIGETEMNLKICNSCGSVIQDPVVSPEVMQFHYENLSNYTNVSRDGRPDSTSIEAMTRQTKIIENHITTGSVFEVGCATGYTLSELKRKGWLVSGCEPSASASNVARKLYEIEVQTGQFENIEIPDKAFDLVLISHVLEHLYEPIKCLKKVNKILKDKGYLLVEVPCLTNPENWGNGYFTFEHINLFSKNTLENCIVKSGFLPKDVVISLNSSEYPVVTVMAQKVQIESESISYYDSPLEIRELIDTYLQSNESEWNRINILLAKELNGFKKIVIWGGGVHTSQLLRNTTSIHRDQVVALVDIDASKHGMEICGIKICSSTMVDLSDPAIAIVISSKAYENEIKLFLLNQMNLQSKMICLYQLNM